MKGNLNNEVACGGEQRAPVNPVSMTNSIGRVEPLGSIHVKVTVACISITMPEITCRHALLLHRMIQLHYIPCECRRDGNVDVLHARLQAAFNRVSSTL